MTEPDPSTSDLREGERVVFTGYAPAVAEMYGVLTAVLRRPPGHPEAGRVTGYVITLDGGNATICAEPDQLHRETR